MSIINICADSYSKGQEVAKKVSQKMGYRYISQDVITSASKDFGIPEATLVRATQNAPSILDIFSNGRQRYIAYLEAALAEFMLEGNIVYQGLVGYPFIQMVSHSLKVRVIANLKDRIGVEMRREHMSPAKARKIVLSEDERRERWAKAVYGIDITDPGLYDLVINVGHIKTEDADDAVETIISTVKHKKFQPMTYSLNCAKNIALSCRVRAALVDTDPTIKVRSDEGTVYVYSKVLRRKKQKGILDFKARLMKIPGVEHVEVYVEKDLFSSIARGQ